LASADQILAVRKAQQYILDHLQQKISLYDIAMVCGYSPWHISRMFKEVVGVAMFDYIRKLRLSEAAKLIRDEPIKILDVALTFMFDSHEGFSRAFSKQFGMSPKRYQIKTPPINLFMPYPVMSPNEKEMIGEKVMKEKSKTVFVQVIERPKRKMLIKRSKTATDYYSFCEENGCDDWGLFCSIKEAINEPMGLWMPKNMRPEGTGEYAMGVEVPVDYSGVVPEGYEVIDLGPCMMMIFQGEPFDDNAFEQAISNLWDVIDDYDPMRYGFEWAKQDAPRFQFSPEGYRGYMEGRPVRLAE